MKKLQLNLSKSLSAKEVDLRAETVVVSSV